MHTNKNKLKQIIVYTIIIFSIISVGNMFRCVFDHNDRLPNLAYLIVYLACIAGVTLNKRVTKRSIVVFLIEGMYFLFYFTIRIRGAYIIGTAKSVVFVFLLMSIYFINLIYRNDEQIFFDALSNIVCIIAAISLFFWVFGSILNVVPGRQQVTYQWATFKRSCNTFYYIYYEIPVQSRLLSNGFRLYRNTAIFPESPGSASFFIYGIINELIFKKEKNKVRICIILMALLSTFSTKGILVLIEIVVYAIWVKYIKNRRSLLSRVLLVVSPFILLLAGTIAYNVVSLKNGTSTFLMRADDLESAIKVWKNYPILGTGYVTDQIIDNFTYSRNFNGLSMGIAVQLAKGGIYMILIYFVPLFHFIINNKCKIKDVVDRLLVVIVLITKFYL